MRLLMGVVIAAVIGIGLSTSFNKMNFSDDDVVMVPSDDVQMNAAIARARETLPMFWAVHEKPEPEHSDMSLKVEISDGENSEHFWLGSITRESGSLIGTINNEPQLVFTVKYQQRYTFSSDAVTDWMYMKNDKIYGGYTIRVLVDKSPGEEADALRAMLAFEPK